MKTGKNHLRIAITLPYLFTVRDFLFTPVWDEMVKRENVHFSLLCNNENVGKLISKRKCANISFVKFPPSRNNRKLLPDRILRADLGSRIWIRLFQWLDAKYVFDSLMYRFAALNNLSHQRIRRERSRELRREQQIFSDYRMGEIAGFPFPKSRTIFRLLYGFRNGLPNLTRKEDMVFLQEMEPDLFVFGRLHFHTTQYWAKALRRLGIPMIGIISSWDHPTTKGPTPRGMSGYVVASKCMVEEMSNLHGIQKNRICQIGKLQMDAYTNPSILTRREDFLKELHLPSDHRLVTFGTNTTGLKEHEVSIAQKLAVDFANGCYGKATLLIRTHPQDTNWKRDFLSLTRPPWVVCLNACSFGNQLEDRMSRGNNDLTILANLMKHSDVIIQSRGSLALDAIAFDTPVISLAFDGSLARAERDSFLMEYGVEHYKPLVTARGTWMVGSYKTLDYAIREYLRDREIHSEGRRTIRREHIEPLDSKASQRLVDHLVESAMRAREGSLSQGDWDYTGIGDTTWASHQTCNVRDYVQK